MSENITVISKGTIFCGKVSIDGSIDVSGTVTGKVIANKVFIKNNGNVKGDIYAREMIISNGGNVQGDVFVKRLKMLKGAEITGNIHYYTLSIEDGAKIMCTCEVVNEDDFDTKINEVKQEMESEKQ